MSDKELAIKKVCEKIVDECARARAKHGSFNSTHEAYGVIMEELDEWWDSVKADTPDDEELLSVAAMAVLAIVELQGRNKQVEVGNACL